MHRGVRRPTGVGESAVTAVFAVGGCLRCFTHTGRYTRPKTLIRRKRTASPDRRSLRKRTRAQSASKRRPVRRRAARHGEDLDPSWRRYARQAAARLGPRTHRRMTKAPGACRGTHASRHPVSSLPRQCPAHRPWHTFISRRPPPKLALIHEREPSTVDRKIAATPAALSRM